MTALLILSITINNYITMKAEQYWEHLLTESFEGTISRDIVTRIFEDAQQILLEKLSPLIKQAKLVDGVYFSNDFDDSFIEQEMVKLRKELRTL